MALTPQETVFLCLIIPEPVPGHWRPLQSQQEWFKVASPKQFSPFCLAYPPETPKHSPLSYLMLPDQFSFPLWPCVTYSDPPLKTCAYSHPSVSAEGVFSDLPRIPESKDAQVPYTNWSSLSSGSASENSTKCSSVLPALVESVDWELGFWKSGWYNELCSSISLSCSSHATSPPPGHPMNRHV